MTPISSTIFTSILLISIHKSFAFNVSIPPSPIYPLTTYTITWARNSTDPRHFLIQKAIVDVTPSPEDVVEVNAGQDELSGTAQVTIPSVATYYWRILDFQDRDVLYQSRRFDVIPSIDNPSSSLSSSTTSTSPAPSGSQAPQDSPQSSTKKTPVGGIVGGVVGGLAAICIAVLVLLFIRRRRRGSSVPNSTSGSTPTPYIMEEANSDAPLSSSSGNAPLLVGSDSGSSILAPLRANHPTSPLQPDVQSVTSGAPTTTTMIHFPDSLRSANSSERRAHLDGLSEEISSRISVLQGAVSSSQAEVESTRAELQRLRAENELLRQQQMVDWASGLTEDPPPLYEMGQGGQGHERNAQENLDRK